MEIIPKKKFYLGKTVENSKHNRDENDYDHCLGFDQVRLFSWVHLGTHVPARIETLRLSLSL